ncbi:hypothetical protein P152DRAFT_453537 [Eremomyces bilateralis CBS 781.70]|uniref:BZIP domain-containing protein n=1 Tax=Eremomyces bilateralis CBS 781.70 TaxID=1392243 RepID=A0A6G1GGC9_9PEZI|nr:uncharacterized protein P152DRAFT_453537 [Eremomyces bilateralis CBS 781.70]KAF1816929.1 hypothetical protein P152DRAFT_453537 [Eremomyces bilateralis CBS 781.70]
MEKRREDQRRLRNRLSQKAVRERKAARIHQLEQELATVTKGNDSARVTELLNTNSRLRHALLDTRKKLASLSATATQLGEQIKVVLDDRDEVEQDCEDVANQMDSCVFDDQAYHLWRNSPQTCTQSPQTSSTESISMNQEREHFNGTELKLINPSTNVGAEATDRNPIPGQSDKMLVSMDTMFNGSKHTEAMPDLFLGPHLGPKLHVYSGSTLSQHLGHIHGLLRLGGALEGVSSMPQVVDSMWSAFLEHGWPSLKYWFDVTQSTPLATRVLWWQTSNSHEAATQIPPGNTPTLVQLSRPKYPCILDWVPHPGLRDLLILNYEFYDVDQVICDMTNAFVVEIEDHRTIFDESHPGLSLPIGKGYGYNLMELVERTLVFGPMDSQSQQELTVMRLLQSMASSKNASIEHPIHRFKLDPRFFDQYPALYDANAESKYRPKNLPFVQKSQLPLPFTTETVKEYMNVALHAKSTLVAAR